MPKSGGKWKRAASRSFVPRNFYGERREREREGGAFALSLFTVLGDSAGVAPGPPLPPSSSFYSTRGLHWLRRSHESSKVSVFLIEFDLKPLGYFAHSLKKMQENCQLMMVTQ